MGTLGSPGVEQGTLRFPVGTIYRTRTSAEPIPFEADDSLVQLEHRITRQ